MAAEGLEGGVAIARRRRAGKSARAGGPALAGIASRRGMA